MVPSSLFCPVFTVNGTSLVTKLLGSSTPAWVGHVMGSLFLHQDMVFLHHQASADLSVHDISSAVDLNVAARDHQYPRQGALVYYFARAQRSGECRRTIGRRVGGLMKLLTPVGQEKSGFKFRQIC